MIIPLTRFTLRQDRIELHLRPNRAASDEHGAEVALPLSGATGRVDEAFSSAAAVSAPLAFEDDDSRWDVMEPLRLEENVEYDTILVLPMKAKEFEGHVRRSADSVFPFANLKLKQCFSLNGAESFTVLGDGRYRVSGRLRFDNYLGAIDLSLSEEAGAVGLRAEVMSNKLNYEEDFHHLLSELASIHAEIVLNLDAPTEAKFDTSDCEQVSPHAVLLHLRSLFDRIALPVSIATILGNPVSRCRTLCQVEETAFVVRPDYTELQSNPHSLRWSSGGSLASVFRGFTPENLPSSKVEANYDVVENRFVKHAIGVVMQLLRTVQRSLPKQYQASHRRLAEWSVELEMFLTHPFWQAIGDCTSFPCSMVMQERHGYRDFLQQILRLDLALAYHRSSGAIEPITGDLQPIWKLYEIWCYFQLRSLLSEITGCPGEPAIESVLRTKGYSVDLISGVPGRTTYEYTHVSGNALCLELFYTKKVKPIDGRACSWEGSYSTEWKPDFGIRISLPTSTHWVFFDAKYRVSFQRRAELPAAVAVGDEDALVRWFRSEDLNVMHAYRDAILGARGCYLLYPGNTSRGALFVRHYKEGYRSKQPGPSVGAFPLCPSKGGLIADQRDLLRLHLDKMITAFVESGDYREEEGFN